MDIQKSILHMGQVLLYRIVGTGDVLDRLIETPDRVTPHLPFVGFLQHDPLPLFSQETELQLDKREDQPVFGDNVPEGIRQDIAGSKSVLRDSLHDLERLLS